MVELSKNSTSVTQKKRLQKEKVTEDKVSSSAFESNVLDLDKERFEDILENIPSAVVVLEKPDGKVTFANKRAVELYGVDPCGIQLKNHLEFLKVYSMDGKSCLTEELFTYRALFNEETVRNASVIVERPDGKRFTILMSAKPLYSKDGEAKGAVAIFDDVTDYVKIQNAFIESEDRLKTAQRLAHMGSWEYYVKEDRAIWSEELFRIFGLKPQQYGPNTSDYVAQIHPEDRETINKEMEQMLFKGDVLSKASFDYRIIREDGSVRTIHSERMVREVGEDEKPIRIAGIEQDITERREIEQKVEDCAKILSISLKNEQNN